MNRPSAFIPLLARFLADHFSATELNLFVLGFSKLEIARGLPGMSASPIRRAHAAAVLMVKHGVIDRTFFVRLQDARGKAQDAISNLQTTWERVGRDRALDEGVWSPCARWLQWGAALLLAALCSYGLHQSDGFRDVVGLSDGDKYAGAVFGAAALGCLGLVPWLHALRHGVSLSRRAGTLRPYPIQVWLPADWCVFQRTVNTALVVLLLIVPVVANVAAVSKFMHGTACEMTRPGAEPSPKRAFVGWRGHLLGQPMERAPAFCSELPQSSRAITYGTSAQSYWPYVEPWLFTVVAAHNTAITLWTLYLLALLRKRNAARARVMPGA